MYNKRHLRTWNSSVYTACEILLFAACDISPSPSPSLDNRTDIQITVLRVYIVNLWSKTFPFNSFMQLACGNHFDTWPSLTSHALAHLATAVRLSRLLVFVFVCLFVCLFFGVFFNRSIAHLFWVSLRDLCQGANCSPGVCGFRGIKRLAMFWLYRVYLTERLVGHLDFGLFVCLFALLCYFLYVPPFLTVRKRIEPILCHILPSVSGTPVSV